MVIIVCALLSFSFVVNAAPKENAKNIPKPTPSQQAAAERVEKYGTLGDKQRALQNVTFPLRTWIETNRDLFVKEPEKTCETLESFFKRIEERDQEIIKTRLGTFVLLPTLFEIRQALIKNSNYHELKCFDQITEAYFKIKELEQDMILTTGGNVQKPPYTLVQNNPQIYQVAPFKSNYFKGDRNLELKTGDVIYFSSMIPIIDYSRSITTKNEFYSYPALVYKPQGKEAVLIYIDALKGINFEKLEDKMKDFVNEFIILRPIDPEVGERAVELTFKKVIAMSAFDRKMSYDWHFNTVDTKQFYPAEFVYNSYQTAAPNFFKRHLTDKFKVDPDSFIAYMASGNSFDIVTARSILFSGGFELVGEWSLASAVRIFISSDIAQRHLINLNHQIFVDKDSTRAKMMETVWNQRENFLIKKTLNAFGAKEEFFAFPKFSFMIGAFQMRKVLYTCVKEVYAVELAERYTKKTPWMTRDDLRRAYANCEMKVRVDPKNIETKSYDPIFEESIKTNKKDSGINLVK